MMIPHVMVPFDS